MSSFLVNLNVEYSLLGLFIFAQSIACPNHQIASKCCSEFYTSYRHLHWPSCQTFEYLDKCFSVTQCELTELATVCSDEYRKVHNRHVPKQAIVAVYENLRRKCTNFCSQYSKLESECMREYKENERIEREQDQILNQDIQNLKRQLQHGSAWWSTGDLCKNLVTNLKKLHGHRYGICNSASIYCLCKRLENDLSKTCLFRCDQFRYYDVNGQNRVTITVIAWITRIILMYWGLTLIRIF